MGLQFVIKKCKFKPKHGNIIKNDGCHRGIKNQQCGWKKREENRFFMDLKGKQEKT